MDVNNRPFTTLVIGDIHNHTDSADKVLAEYRDKIDEVVFVGDYFDDFNDDAIRAGNTARWLKSRLYLPNYHFLFGNHDMSYAFTRNKYLSCSGFTPHKSRTINSILKKRDWERLKLIYKTQGFLISHAGITRECFENPIHGLTEDIVMQKCKQALEDAEDGRYSSIFQVGYYRGGQCNTGGITWADWNELKPLKGFKQILGHSPNKKVRSTYIPNKKYKIGENHCIDCYSKYFGLIENGIFKIIEVTNNGYNIKDV